LNPGAIAEGRVVPNMLAMPAIQVSNPILLVVLMIPYYWLIHVIEYERKSGEGVREYTRRRKFKLNEGLVRGDTHRTKRPTRRRGNYGLRLSWGG
jgi:hypothetical protein